MRVLIVASDPGQGLLYYPVRLAMALAALNADVAIVSWGEGEQSPGLHDDVVRAKIPHFKCDSLSKNGTSALFAEHLGIFKVLEAFSPDTLLAFGPVSATQFHFANFSRNRPLRIVSFVAAMGHDQKNPFFARAGAALLNHVCHAVLAQCHLESLRLRDALVRPEKLRVVHNPVDCSHLLAQAGTNTREATLQRYGLSPDKRFCGYIASFQPRKKHELLLRAFAEIHQQYPDFELVFVGPGEGEACCRAHVQRLGLEQKVHFLGRLPNSEVPGLLKAIDVAVHCSTAETFGYSMVEPLLFGKPVVMTRVGVAYEIERADVATVVSPDDVSALTHALTELFGMGERVRQRAERGPAFVRREFDVGRIAVLLGETFKDSPGKRM